MCLLAECNTAVKWRKLSARATSSLEPMADQQYLSSQWQVRGWGYGKDGRDTVGVWGPVVAGSVPWFRVGWVGTSLGEGLGSLMWSFLSNIRTDCIMMLEAYLSEMPESRQIGNFRQFPNLSMLAPEMYNYFRG